MLTTAQNMKNSKVKVASAKQTSKLVSFHLLKLYNESAVFLKIGPQRKTYVNVFPSGAHGVLSHDAARPLPFMIFWDIYLQV